MEKHNLRETPICQMQFFCSVKEQRMEQNIDISYSRSPVPRRSLLTRCPREVWERAGERTLSRLSSRRVFLSDITAHGRVQDWPRRERLGTRLVALLTFPPVSWHFACSNSVLLAFAYFNLALTVFSTCAPLLALFDHASLFFVSIFSSYPRVLALPPFSKPIWLD